MTLTAIKNLLILVFGNILIFLNFFYIINFFLKKPLLIVLNYHNFSSYNNFNLKRGSVNKLISSIHFESQLNWLTNNFEFLYPEEFLMTYWIPRYTY